jgi:hypothetical protein
MLRDRQQRREVAKIKTTLRLCFSATLREQKKNVSPPCCGTGRLCVNYFFDCMERVNQSTQPQGAGGVSIGLVRSNRTENSVAAPSLLRL